MVISFDFAARRRRLSHVEGSYQTPCGIVASEWTRGNGTFRLKVVVPPNTTAEVRLPTGGGKAESTSRGAAFLRIEGDRAVYSVASGSHDFTARDAHAQP